MSLLRRLLNLRPNLLHPPIESAVPFWESRPPRAGPPRRLRVIWTGTQVAPLPILVEDPPEFDPTR